MVRGTSTIIAHLGDPIAPVKSPMTRERGCRTQVGTERLFEQIPLYLEFFGFGAVTSDQPRAVAAPT